MTNIVTGLLIIVILLGFFMFFIMSGIFCFATGSEIAILDELLQYFEQAFLDLFAFIGGDVEDFFVDLGDDIVNSAEYMEKEIEEGFNMIIDGAEEMFNEFEDETVYYMDKFISYITGAADDMYNDITDCYKVMTGAIVSACDDMMEAITVFTGAMIHYIDETFSWFETYLPNAIYGAFLDLYDDMTGWAFWLGATLEQFFYDCTNGLIYAGSELVDYGQKIYDSIVDGLITITDGAIKYIDSGINAVTKAAKDAGDALNPSKW